MKLTFLLSCLCSLAARRHFLGGSAKIVCKSTEPNHTVLARNPGSEDLDGDQRDWWSPRPQRAVLASIIYTQSRLLLRKHIQILCRVRCHSFFIPGTKPLKHVGEPRHVKQLLSSTSQTFRRFLFAIFSSLNIFCKLNSTPLLLPNLLVAIGFSSGISTHVPADHNWQSSSQSYEMPGGCRWSV